MKNKVLAAIIVVVLALTLTACGEDKESSVPASSNSSSSDETSSQGFPEGSDNSSDDEPGLPSSSEPEPADPEKPALVETRLYVHESNPSWNYYVEIYSNGGWSVSQINGNKESYISYSFDDESAGAYADVQSYNLATDPPTYQFDGEVRFAMTDSTLTVWKRTDTDPDQEPDVFVRHSLDEPLY